MWGGGGERGGEPASSSAAPSVPSGSDPYFMRAGMIDWLINTYSGGGGGGGGRERGGGGNLPPLQLLLPFPLDPTLTS